MLANAAGAIFRVKASGGEVIYINAAAERIFGYSLEEYLADKSLGLNIIHPDYRDRQKEIIEEFFAEKKTIKNTVLGWIAKDGRNVLMEYTIIPVLGKDSEILYFESIGRDITERKRIEEKLEEEFRMRTALLDNIPNCIALILKKGTREIVASNQAAQQIGAVPGKTCYQTCAERDDACSFCLAPELWRTNEAKQIEVKYKGRYFEGIWVSLNQDLYVHYIFDITERKQVAMEKERALAETSALLEGLRGVLDHPKYEDCARVIFDCCKRLTGATAGYVTLLSADGSENEVLFLNAGGHNCTVNSDLPMPIRGLREQAYAKGKTVYNNDFAESKWWGILPKGHVHLENILFAPLVIDKKTVGLIALGNKPGGFDDEDARLATAFGEYASIALHRKRTKEKLRKASTYIDAMGTALIVLDMERKVIEFNAAAMDLLGYSQAEICGLTFEKLFPDSEHDKHYAAMKETLEDGKIGSFETSVLTKNDNEVPVLISGSVLKDVEDKPIGFVGVLRDITERKQAEEEREKALHDMGERIKELRCLYGVTTSIRTRTTIEETFQDAAELIPPAWHYPEITRGRIIFDAKEYVSEPFEETGWKQSSDIIVNGQRQGSIEVYYLQECPDMDEGPFMTEERNLINGIARNISEAIERKQAEEALTKYKIYLEELVEERTLKLSTSNKLLNEEITERKQAEEALQKNREELQTILDSVPSTIWYKDTENRLIRVNKAAADSLGMKLEDLEGRLVRDIFPEKVSEKYYKDDLEVIRSGKAKLNIIEQMPLPSGENRWVHTDKIPYYDRQGDIAGVIAFVDDITERKELAETQEQQFAQLAHMSRLTTAGELSSSLAHDLNQPLCAIATLSEGCKRLISSGKTEGDDIREGIDEISAQAARAGQIIRRMRRFVTKQEPKRSTVDIKTIISESISLMGIQIRQANVNIKHECLDKAIEILVDRIQLQQVLINIMQNGIDAMENLKPEQRILSISTSIIKEEFIEIATKDNGKGFSDVDKEMLFQPFFTTKSEGMGIGLAISVNTPFFEQL